MPVEKISDAPANIRELDDVKLTLAQINEILATYDAIKDDKKLESPMAVAIAQFKKSHHIEDGAWVKNKKKGEDAIMIDVEKLDNYIVLKTGDKAPADVPDIREFETDFGPGVYGLWSDAEQTFIAFAFEPTRYDEESARAWLKNQQEKNFSGLDLIREFFGPLTRLFTGGAKPKKPMQARGYDEIRRLLDDALEAMFPRSSDASLPYDDPWIVDFGLNAVIFDLGRERYVASYSISADDAVTISQYQPVDEQWVKPDGSPVILHSFDVRLGSGEEAEEPDDGLIWKELIHPGKWYKMDTGRIVEVTEEIIQAIFDAWKAGLPKYISVPADHHHQESNGSVPAEANRGFVKKLKLIGKRLFGGFMLTDPDTSYGVQTGSTADCSVSIVPDVIHPETGKQYDWVLQHVLLTNEPLVQDLSPFGVAASGSDGDAVVVSYRQYNNQSTQEVNAMSGQSQKQSGAPGEGGEAPQGIVLSAEDQAMLDTMRGMQLSAGDVQVMLDERQAVRTKARELEITKVVRALEGKEEHPAVVQIEGYRHSPVVCAAVEKVLKEKPQAMNLFANDDGGTEIDALVLDIVNAIPEAGRVALSSGEAAPAGTHTPEETDPTLQAEGGEVSDEQIVALDKMLK